MTAEEAQRSDSENDYDSDREKSERKEKEMEKAMKENIPDAVDHFLGLLLKALETRNVAEVHHLYEEQLNKLTDKHYKTTKWPSPLAVQVQISGQALFLILYKELYYRHIYSRLAVTPDDRKNSWDNYCTLLNLFIDDLSTGDNLSAALPIQWLWDILDEFVYHYQTYCNYRTKSVKKHEKKDMDHLRNNPGVFDTTKVLSYLTQIVKYSKIQEYLSEGASAAGDRKQSFTDESVRMLGYFSIMQLLRMHSLLGDYDLAMRTIKCMDFKAEVPLFYRIPACHITLYYYMGFAYMMMRRYVDAIRMFSDVLVFMSKTSGVNSLSYQYEQMAKKQDQMYCLLLLCVVLCPQPLDEALEKTIREKHAEKQGRLHRGEELCFEELFSYSSPKFVPAAPPNYDELDSFNAGEAHKLQLNLFLKEVKQQQFLPTIGAYMKLYTSLRTSKLAQLCEMDEEGLRDQLLCVMVKTRQLVREDDGPALSGVLKQCSEVEFYLDGDVAHINSQKPHRPHSEVFLEHILKFQDTLRKMGHV